MSLNGSPEPPGNEYHDQEGFVGTLDPNLNRSRRGNQRVMNPSNVMVTSEYPSPAVTISNSWTLQDRDQFQDRSLQWRDTHVHNGPTIKGARLPNPHSIHQRPPGPFAIYIVWRSSGRSLTLIPHHHDLFGNGRPDLFIVRMTSRSRDLLNPGTVRLGNYRIGDAIAVTRLERHYTARDDDFCKSYQDMWNPEKNRFWMLGDFFLIQREVVEHCLMTKLSRKLTESSHHTCIADGFNVPVRFDMHAIAAGGIVPKSGKMCYGTVFKPILQPGTSTNGIRRRGRKSEEISMVDEHSPIIHFYPILVSCEKMPHDVEEDLKSAPRIFEELQVGDKKVPNILHTTGHFGLSGFLTMENRNRDLAFYPTKVLGVWQPKKKGAQKNREKAEKEDEELWKITFGLNTASGPPCPHLWSPQTKFSLNYKNCIFEMIVESCFFSRKNKFMIIAKPVSKNYRDLRVIKELKGKNVVIFQAILDNMHHLRCFPDVYTFREIQWESQFGKVLMGLLKGSEKVEEDPKEFKLPPTGSSKNLLAKLTPEQSAYARAMLQGSSQALVVDSCFRSGKTMVIAVTANLLALRDSEELENSDGSESVIKGSDYSKSSKDSEDPKSSNDAKKSNDTADFKSLIHHNPDDSEAPQRIHVACSTTNLATTYLLRAHLSLPNHSPAVRLISQSGYDKTSKHLQSRIDFPGLWPRVLKNFVEDFSRRVLGRTDALEMADDVLKSAIWHLANNGYRRRHLETWELGDLGLWDFDEFAEKSFKAPLSLFETFFAIYKPRIVFGTVSALIEGFFNGSWRFIKDKISTVQFDNAHQLPMYLFVSLCTWLPNARYGFLGSPKQLPPYNGKLAYQLDQFAIGDILGCAMKKFPKFEFRSVYKTSPSIIKLCDDLFYEPYEEGIHPADVFEASQKLNVLTGTNSAIQVLDLFSYHYDENSHSLQNRDEAKLATNLVKRLRNAMPNASIGVLCYYKAQYGRVATTLNNVFINTIDASQDHTFDIVVILTTRTKSFEKSNFLADAKRLNVALTRARLGAFVIMDTRAADGFGVWNRFVGAVPMKGAKSFVKQLQKKSNGGSGRRGGRWGSSKAGYSMSRSIWGRPDFSRPDNLSQPNRRGLLGFGRGFQESNDAMDRSRSRRPNEDVMDFSSPWGSYDSDDSVKRSRLSENNDRFRRGAFYDNSTNRFGPCGSSNDEPSGPSNNHFYQL